METRRGTRSGRDTRGGGTDEVQELLAGVLEQLVRSGSVSERAWRELDARVGALTPREHGALIDSYDRPRG
jgi:hypothetical protein